jgi:uracil-DNA glycosylase
MARSHDAGLSVSAADFLPARRSLSALRRAAAGCEGCPLYRDATQTVFGEGPRDARLMLVGEKPGDQEDRQGHPFVGPAGRLLDDALEAAGVRRGAVYLTNAVKHFKWKPAGKRRLHQKPTVREMKACRPWLLAEIAVVRPAVVVCLGATAAQSLLGTDFRLTRHRGEILRSGDAARILATLHPSSIFRIPDRHRQAAAFAGLADDLRTAAAVANGRTEARPSV